jgi:hypothetical protein
MARFAIDDLGDARATQGKDRRALDRLRRKRRSRCAQAWEGRKRFHGNTALDTDA